MSKRRDANFTKEETDKLMELVEQYLDVILNNKCTSEVNRQKEDAWSLIAEEFNSFTTNHRTAKQLKHKLENTKKRSELRALQQRIHTAKSNNQSLDGNEDEHSMWLKRLQQDKTTNSKTDTDWEDNDNDWGGREDDDGRDSLPVKKLKIQTIYVKPLPTLNCGDALAHKIEMESEQPEDEDNKIINKKIYTTSQVTELFKLELKQKHERHRQQMEYEKKLQEAQLNKLALEARIYEAQLNKTNLEVKQLTKRLQREEQMHQSKMSRDAELHALQMERATTHHPFIKGNSIE